MSAPITSRGLYEELLELEPAAAPTISSQVGWRSWLLPVALPIALVGMILGADQLEGPKTAYVGVLAVIPMLAAVFGTPLQTGIVGVVAWASAFTFGHIASDGNAMAQEVRLIIIAASVVGAVFAARHRQRREHRLAVAERERALMDQLRHDATTDLLTGALNRRGLLMSIADLDRSGPVTLAVADFDNFKWINDQHGHLTGDRCLRATALRLERNVSERDLIGRWGGDEFLIVLPLPMEEATSVIERLSARVTADPIECCGTPLPVSLTFGLAQWQADESLDSVLLRADRAMYSGKGLDTRVHLSGV